MSFKRWGYDPAHNAYTGTYGTVETMPSGLYQVWVDDHGKPCARMVQRKDDRLLRFKHGPMDPILMELGRFWESGQRYKDLGVTHKRGILLHGPHGCGKTAILGAAIDSVIDKKGIVVQMDSPNSLAGFVPLMRQIEGERPILVVMEDLDAICEDFEYELLEMMDGASSLGHNILFLGTTNNLGKIPTRVRCRPSRIDTLMEVPLPTEKQRLEYLRFICSGKFQQSESTLETWADKSDGFSLATLKELVISMIVFERTIDETITRLKQLGDED